MIIKKIREKISEMKEICLFINKEYEEVSKIEEAQEIQILEYIAIGNKDSFRIIVKSSLPKLK